MRIQCWQHIVIFSALSLLHNQFSSASVQPTQINEGKNRGWIPRMLKQERKEENIKDQKPPTTEESKDSKRKKKKDKKTKEKKDSNIDSNEKKPKENEGTDDKPMKKPNTGGIFGFGRGKTPEQANKTATSTIKNTNTTTTEKSSLNTTASETTTQQESQNSTSTAKPKPSPKNQPVSPNGMRPMQMQRGMVFLNLDESGKLSSKRNSRRNLPIDETYPLTPAGKIYSEAIASILSTCIRLWFLTSLTKWLSNEEIKSLKKPTQHFVWERLNDVYSIDSEALQSALKAPPAGVSQRKWKRIVKRRMQVEKGEKEKKGKKRNDLDDQHIFNRTIVVLDLNPSGEFDVIHFEEVVTFVVSQHRKKVFETGEAELEIVILVKSPGGSVSKYGLGAVQMNRLSREDGITTTVCVDTMAASGGYMIASQADKLLAAPFAYVGSIGVIREQINFNKALERFGVSPIILTAGTAKAPITSFGEVTKEGKNIAQMELKKIHAAFRKVVIEGRPVLAENIEEVSNGDVFLGREAKDLNMVDDLITSEEYLLERILAGDRVLKLYRLPRVLKRRLRFNPVDFLKNNDGLRDLLRSQDISKLLPRLLQAVSFAQLFRHVMKKNLSI